MSWNREFGFRIKAFFSSNPSQNQRTLIHLVLMLWRRGYNTDYSGGYPVKNSYGPPRDYYYDERPEYYSPYDQASHHLHSNGPPPEVIYHQHPNPHLQHHQHGGGEVHNSGELNVQPLLLPLAGIALLGVLSALVKTPLLLQLGHIGRRRRRRDANDSDGRIAAETIKSLLEKVNIF